MSGNKNRLQRAWNKGRIVGPKPALSRDQVQVIRHLLRQVGPALPALRDLALFTTAIDTSFRGADLVQLKVEDVRQLGGIRERVRIQQGKTGTPVAVSLSPTTRASLAAWIDAADKLDFDWLFTGVTSSTQGKPITADNYRRLVKGWIKMAGLDPKRYGSHSLRRTQPAHIYAQTGNLRAVQLLLGHANIGTTARYLGVEEEEALAIAERFHL